MTIFSRSHLGGRTSCQAEHAPPIFIVGVGRSGTSLIHSMLAAHSQVALPPEINFIRRYLAKNRILWLARRKGVGAVRRRLLEDRYIQRMGVNVETVVGDVAKELGHMTDLAIYTGLLRSYAEKHGKPRFGDKDPRSVEYLPLLKRYFPHAYVVHVIRDPRDVLASKKKAAWSLGRSSFQHLAANMLQLRMGRRLGPRLFGERYHELIYEKLLADPEETVRTLTSEIDLEYEPIWLGFSTAAKTLVSSEEMEWKKETLGELIRNNSGKWRRDLGVYEVAMTEAICREAMATGKYDRSLLHVNIFQQILITTGSLLIELFALAYSFYRAITIWRSSFGVRWTLSRVQ